VRIGIQLPEVEREVRWSEYLAMARAAEAAGFDSIWVGDHLLYRDGDGRERGPRDAWTLLAALAAGTQRVQLGPLVACTAFHPPGLIARMAATLAEVSGRRFVLGLGAGWNEQEFRAFGLPFDHRVSRFEESFTIIRRLLAGERVTFAGSHFQAQDAVLIPAPPARPRLMIGSNGPRMLALALPHVDVWNTWYEDFGNSAEGFAALNDRISAAARLAGRDPMEIQRSACVYVGLDGSGAGRASKPDAPPLEGPPPRLAASLSELAEAGADEAILVVNPISERSIRELAEVVALLGPVKGAEPHPGQCRQGVASNRRSLRSPRREGRQ
jgi:alkanesulfonate monooxygenase SsuD/methylene tetrahydromethanopterin reductase-like flavin-dependent oxidoreductase (luciferase family)